jgi:SAM-dependent methyltransferase
MSEVCEHFRSGDFWRTENLRWARPYFKLEKSARIVNDLCRGRQCDLLDVGCGPLALLSRLLNDNIRYYGIDIAPQMTSSTVIEADVAKTEIGFRGQKFDIVVASAIFEYLGPAQNQKFREIASILRPGGKFVTTYTNFQHVNDHLIDHSIYNNVRPIAQFKRDLEQCFRVDRWFPSSHNWHCSEPRRKLLRVPQMRLRLRIPVLSPLLAVNYFFVCSLP